MSPQSADSGSDNGPPSQKSINGEVQLIYEVIAEDKLQNTKDPQDIIVVVREESVPGMKIKLKKSVWQKFRTGDSRSRILVSNNNSLQATIDHLDKDSRARHILILVSPQLGSLYEFDVSSEYTTLMILRCGHGKIHSKEPHGRVRITPGSTFAGIRISDWDEEERTRELYIGEGVGIPSSFNKLNSKTSSVNSLSPSEKERLYQTFQDMRNTDMSGKWWREWRGKVAAIVGLTVGAGKAMIGMHATATGVFIDMKYGLFALKAGGIQTSAVVTAAGSACLLGVGVAAAVYFIPWDDLFSWLGNLISSFFSWLWKVWQEFMEWVSDKIECLRSHVASRMEAARAMKHK